MERLAVFKKGRLGPDAIDDIDPTICRLAISKTATAQRALRRKLAALRYHRSSVPTSLPLAKIWLRITPTNLLRPGGWTNSSLDRAQKLKKTE
jgi:hypothetical protein